MPNLDIDMPARFKKNKLDVALRLTVSLLTQRFPQFRIAASSEISQQVILVLPAHGAQH